MKKCDSRKQLQWNIKKIVMFVIKHLQMNQMLVLDNP